MSAIYITGTDGRKRVYSFREILEIHDHEAQVLKAISELERYISDMSDYQGDFAQVIEQLPGFWDRAHAEPVIEKLEDTSRIMDTSKQYLEDAVRNLNALVKAGQNASQVERQYPNYDFRSDHYRGMSGMYKWKLHLHFSV